MKQALVRSLISALVLAVFAACGNIPAIGSLQPDHGKIGSEVNIVGGGFGDKQGAGKVTFTAKDGPVDLKPSDIISWSPALIRVRVPLSLVPGESSVIVEHDNGTTSNRKKFKVETSEIPTSDNQIVVANQSQPGFQVFEVLPAGNGPTAPELGLSYSVAEAGFDTQIRGVLAIPSLLKIYVTVFRDALSGNADDDRSELLVIGHEGSVTAATSIDVGLLPSGMAATPDNSRIYVTSTATGRLTAIETQNDTVEQEFSLDLAARSYGFEPVSVVIANSTDLTLGSYLVSVIGNNWYAGVGEVITFAPAATEASRMLVSDLPLTDTLLNGSYSLAVSGPTLWVSGDRNGFASVAAIDIEDGRLIDQADFRQGQIGLTGFADGVTLATDVLVAPAANRLFVALPSAGVAALTLITDSTQAVLPATADLVSIARPTKMGALLNADGSFDNFLVMRPDARSVDRVSTALEVTADYFSTETAPTLLGTFFSSATKLIK